MKYIKLNTNWNAEPNAPDPQLERGEDFVEIRFELNQFTFDYIEEGDIGIIEFAEVYKIDFGTMNDEGYFRGQHRFSNNNLPWGEFYELLDSNWETTFPTEAKILNKDIDKSELRHFIFFLRDNTIECLANKYYFSIRFAKQSFYDNKYPDGFFHHYLSMFSVHYTELNKQNLKTFNKLYIQFEGKNKFKELQVEVETIKRNDDFSWYLKQAQADQIDNVNLESISKAAESILSYSTK